MADSKIDHSPAFDRAVNYVVKYQYTMTDRDSWTLNDWVFNSCLKQTGKRILTRSRNIARIMKVSDSDFEKDEMGFWTVFETDMSEPIVIKVTYHENKDDKEGFIVWELHPDYNEIVKGMILRLTK